MPTINIWYSHIGSNVRYHAKFGFITYLNHYIDSIEIKDSNTIDITFLPICL